MLSLLFARSFVSAVKIVYVNQSDAATTDVTTNGKRERGGEVSSTGEMLLSNL